MSRMFQRIIALGLLALAVPCLAATPGASYDNNGFDARLLDASVPQAQRMQLFAHMVQLAEQGEVPAQDLAGTLFWQGNKIAGSPVAQNLTQARKLLAYAAVHGDVMAMAKMSELQLAAGQPAKAMVWVQLYAHYLDPMRKARQQHGRMYNYATDLMERIEKAGGKISPAVSKDVNSMVTRFDKPIRAGILAFKQQHRHGHTFLTTAPLSQANIPRDKINWNGVADFLVAFNPDGSQQKVWLLAAWPNPQIADMLRPWVEYARANSVDKSSGIRYLEIPVTYNAVRAKQLRAHH
ncbi:MAG TPA: hypothetical protein VF271_07975 [Rhodanobacteraceae bacterium]